MSRLYAFLIRVVAPLAAVFFLWRSLRDPMYRERLGERFGRGRSRLARPGIWVHAVSVGEVVAASALVRAVRRAYPELPMVLTTVTATGARRARELFGDEVLHSWMPFDTRPAVRRFLERMQPRAAIIMETELWPNLYAECRARGIPVLLANARISPRSLRRYGRFPRLLRAVLGENVTVAAQGETDAARFRALGADPGRVIVAGNLKADLGFPPGMIEDGKAFRAAHIGARPAWIAASTHEGEEEAALDAHQRVQERLGDALLILVPRHPERFAAVAELLARRGLRCGRRSRGETPDSGQPVYLVDTVGELPRFYAAADVAFVGGSLAPIGGHNLLEPALLEMPIVVGPHNFNAPEVAARLHSADALLEVADAAALGDVVSQLLASPGAREAHGRRARAVAAADAGALERLLAVLQPLLRG